MVAGVKLRATGSRRGDSVTLQVIRGSRRTRGIKKKKQEINKIREKRGGTRVRCGRIRQLDKVHAHTRQEIFPVEPVWLIECVSPLMVGKVLLKESNMESKEGVT